MIVRMNLVMTYPVHWSEYSVLSNFVQNFYDALGIEQFAEEFHYYVVTGSDSSDSVDTDDSAEAGNGSHEMEIIQPEQTLVMEASRGFAKEWLYYIGASTKRDPEQKTAGGFGEGFKIASLVSVRDYHLEVEMASRDWTLKVTSVEGDIAGKTCRFLAYDVGERPFAENAVLRLSSVTSKFLEEMEDIMKDFYYEGNPRFGRCLARGEKYAIYEATLSKYDREKNRRIPASGQVFCHYQYRGSIRAPIVVCNHVYTPKNDDRDRNWLSNGQLTDCIRDVLEQLNAQEAWEVLGAIRCAWSEHIDRYRFHEPYWNDLVSALVNIVMHEESVRREFEEQYVDHLVIRDTWGMERDRNRRSMALVWYETSSYRGKRSFVRPCFRQLGVRTVCELCEENDGYTAERDPDPAEGRYIRILRSAAEDVLQGVVALNEKDWPGCRILMNERAPVAGYTKLQKQTGAVNNYGLRVQSRADYVYLQAWNFCTDGFARAFTTYCHELLHQFGGDSSLQFHRALLLMNQRILENPEKLASWAEQWRNIGEAV